MKSYLGLDLSLTATGFFLLREDGSNKNFELKTEPSKFPSLIRRIGFIADKIVSELEGEEVELVMMEDCYAAGGVFAGTGILLSALGTMVRERLLRAGHRYITATPGQIKKFETGSGKAGKGVMIKFVFRNHNFDTSSDNVADACGTAYFCKGYCDWKNDKTDFFQYQMEVLKGMKVKIEEPYKNQGESK